MADADFDDALETDALVAAQEACEQARREYREQRAVRAKAQAWRRVDAQSGAPLQAPSRTDLEFPAGGGSQSHRLALDELRKRLGEMDAVAALLVRVVPDTEKPEHNVVVHLETPKTRRRVWMAAIRSDEGILGDFEEVPMDGALYLIPRDDEDTGVHRLS